MPQENNSSGEEGYILFVDDEQAARETLSECLRASGFKVLVADSYKSTVGVLESGKEIEAIICSLKMPPESGLEVLRHITTEKKGMPVIVLTGRGTLEACQEAFRQGAFDYIIETVEGIANDTDKLVYPLKRAVGEYRLEKENRQMLRDILCMAEEHQKILGELLTDVETKEKVQKRISSILDKWKESQ
jgi:DNA-binding NtrC family response regulator